MPTVSPQIATQSAWRRLHRLLKRLILGTIGAVVVFVMYLFVGSYLWLQANDRDLARLAEFLRSGAVEIPVSAIVGTGWREVCAVSSEDLGYAISKKTKDRPKMLGILSGVYGLESSEWYLALYRDSEQPERVIQSHFVGFVSNTSKQERTLGFGATEFCLPANDAAFVQIPGRDTLALKRIEREHQ